MGLGNQYRRVCGADVRHAGPYVAVVPSGREEDSAPYMNAQMSYSGNPGFSKHSIPENDIQKDVRILIDLLQFKGHVRDAKLGSFALGQRGCPDAQGETKVFIAQTDVLWNRGQQLDLGDNMHGDRVGIVFKTQCFHGWGDRIESRHSQSQAGQREREAVQRDPTPFRVDDSDFVPGRERAVEGGNPRWAERRPRVLELPRGVEIVLRS